MLPILFTPTEFVAVFNQSIDYAFPSVEIEGELCNFKTSKGRWVYFDLKDHSASLKFFGTVYQLPGPLEDGMVLKVVGQPRLSPQFGFSINIQSISLSGQGTIKKAFDLLETKLRSEGLFDESRKRFLPYPPEHIGLITSLESAAYADFVKVVGARFSGLRIELANILVQGEAAPSQIVKAIEYFNGVGNPPEVLVIIRGGGSVDDLQAFSSEKVTRAVAGSRIPTLVAIGHEVDLSLAELAADKRASTPSNAAELLVPDKKDLLNLLEDRKKEFNKYICEILGKQKDDVANIKESISKIWHELQAKQSLRLKNYQSLLKAYSPAATLRRGYSIVRSADKVIRSASQVVPGQELAITVVDGQFAAKVTASQIKNV